MTPWLADGDVRLYHGDGLMGDLEQIRRALIAARDFLNRLPLNDGASRQAIDREFVGVKLIPDALLALDRLARRTTDTEAAMEWTRAVNEELRQAHERAIRLVIDMEKALDSKESYAPPTEYDADYRRAISDAERPA